MCGLMVAHRMPRNVDEGVCSDKKVEFQPVINPPFRFSLFAYGYGK
jgi:hypothetical protein